MLFPVDDYNLVGEDENRQEVGAMATIRLFRMAQALGVSIEQLREMTVTEYLAAVRRRLS